jgi:hypothetical protein
MTKTCTKCGIEKEKELFPMNGPRRRANCRACHNAAVSAHQKVKKSWLGNYTKYKDKKLSYHRAWRERNPNYYSEYNAQNKSKNTQLKEKIHYDNVSNCY